MGGGLPRVRAGGAGERRAEEAGRDFLGSRGNHFHRALCINLHGKEYSVCAMFQRLGFQGDRMPGLTQEMEHACLGDWEGKWQEATARRVRLDAESPSNLGGPAVLVCLGPKGGGHTGISC